MGTDEERLRAAENTAAVALQRIESHEEHCGERWKQAHDTMKEVKAALNALSNRWFKTATTIIGLLIVAVVGLFGKVSGLW